MFSKYYINLLKENKELDKIKDKKTGCLNSKQVLASVRAKK